MFMLCTKGHIMATVTVNYDSELDGLEVVLNGQRLENVNRVSFETHQSWDNPTEMETSCIVESVKVVDGVREYTTLVAKNHEEAKKAAIAGLTVSETHKGFITIKTSDKAK